LLQGPELALPPEIHSHEARHDNQKSNDRGPFFLIDEQSGYSCPPNGDTPCMKLHSVQHLASMPVIKIKMSNMGILSGLPI
jgi:hypothetical protein